MARNDYRSSYGEKGKCKECRHNLEVYVMHTLRVLQCFHLPYEVPLLGRNARMTRSISQAGEVNYPSISLCDPSRRITHNRHVNVLRLEYL